jgi:hypothetical protein
VQVGTGAVEEKGGVSERASERERERRGATPRGERERAREREAKNRREKEKTHRLMTRISGPSVSMTVAHIRCVRAMAVRRLSSASWCHSCRLFVGFGLLLSLGAAFSDRGRTRKERKGGEKAARVAREPKRFLGRSTMTLRRLSFWSRARTQKETPPLAASERSADRARPVSPPPSARASAVPAVSPKYSLLHASSLFSATRARLTHVGPEAEVEARDLCRVGEGGIGVGEGESEERSA